MAKRSRSKPSRQERRDRRVKSDRATAHGLPAASVARPSRPTPSATPLADDAPTPELDEVTPASERRGRSLSQRVKDVSLPIKVAIVAAVALAVIWVFAFAGGPDATRRQPASSASAQPAASAPPSAAPEPVVTAPPTASAAPAVTPTVRTTAQPPPVRRPAVVEDPSPAPAGTPSASAAPPKPANERPRPPSEPPPGPPTSLSGPAKPLEQPPFVTPSPPAPPLPSAYPEPDPLGTRRTDGNEP